MRLTDLLLLSFLGGGNALPDGSNIGNPVNGMWKLIKFLIFVFLLLWFFFNQDLFRIEIKPHNGLLPTSTQTKEQSDGNSIRYRVGAGETLSQIAYQYGVSQERLARFNKLSNPDYIMEGQILSIPAMNKKTEPSGFLASLFD
jgi:LysM repeat protein